MPSPTRIWANWNDIEPLACPAKSLFPCGSLYSLNARCWQPDNHTSPISSRNTFPAGRTKSSGSCAPSPSAFMEIIFMSPLSIASDSLFSISVSTSSELNFGFLRTSLMMSLIAAAVRLCLEATAFKICSLPVKPSAASMSNGGTIWMWISGTICFHILNRPRYRSALYFNQRLEFYYKIKIILGHLENARASKSRVAVYRWKRSRRKSHSRVVMIRTNQSRRRERTSLRVEKSHVPTLQGKKWRAF